MKHNKQIFSLFRLSRFCVFCMLLGFVCKVEAYQQAGGTIRVLYASPNEKAEDVLTIGCNTGKRYSRNRSTNYIELVASKGMTPYQCKRDGTWEVAVENDPCAGNVRPSTKGHVVECVRNVGDYCLHADKEIDVPRYWSLEYPTSNSGCYERKCAKYASLDGLKCKRDKPKWLVVGDVAYKCGDTDFDIEPVKRGIDREKPNGKQEVVIVPVFPKYQCKDGDKWGCKGGPLVGYYWENTGEMCDESLCAEGQALVNGNCVAKECETPGAEVGISCPEGYEYATECKELCTEEYKKKIVITKCGYPYKASASGDKCEIIENYEGQPCGGDTVPLPDNAVRGIVVSNRGVENGVACMVQECESGWHVNEQTKAECLEDIVEEANTESPAGPGETSAAALAGAGATSQVETVAEVSETAEETTGDTTEVPAATPAVTPAAPSGTADGDPCTMSGAEIAEYRGGKCVAVECSPGFKPDGDNCVEVSGPCESLPDNATRGHRQYDAETESEKCIVDDCVDGYVVADDKLSCHEDYEALAEQAREREQSFGNKLLGAVGMGATGIGGSMLMSGLAESASDDEAEIAMKAYLSTFTCKYGNASVTGGTKNVEIPGGNELIQMYADYVALANDLKVRKEALGMQPGIESEPILDSATSGLYDDVSTGKTKGAYASLARALSDPNSEDAKLWAAQREESDEKKKTGAIVAGIGAIGSLLGDIAINKIDWKAKQKKALRDLETSVANIAPPKVKCPSGAAGTYSPNCDCSAIGKNYNPNTNQCEEVETPRVVDTIDTPVAEVETVDVVNEVASTATVERDDAANLSADAMFKFGESDLLPGAQTALDEFVNELRKENFSGCTITVVGHTDTKGGKGFNKNLSEARARSVATYLERPNFEDVIETVNPSGLGETECKCGLTVNSGETYKNDNKDACVNKTPGTPVPDETAFAPCRRVVVSLVCNARSAVGANSTGGNLAATLETVTSIVTPQN